MTQETENPGNRQIDDFLNESAEAVSDKLLRSFIDGIVGVPEEEKQTARKKEKREKATLKFHEQRLNRLKRKKIDVKMPVGRMLDKAIEQLLESEPSAEDLQRLKTPDDLKQWVDGNYTFNAQLLKRLRIFCVKKKVPIYLVIDEAIIRFLSPTSQTSDPEPTVDLTSGFENI